MKTCLSLTFLGTGSALGVPQLGCSCVVCQSHLLANKRSRTCFLIEKNHKKFLLDPGPDIRTQLLKHPIGHLDGVIITHAHHDHIGGFDDLRVYAIRQNGVIPTLIHKRNTQELKKRCDYLFKPGYTYFSLQEIDDDQGHAVFEGLDFRYFTYTQNMMSVTGFVFDSLGFASDIQTIDDQLIANLKGVDTLILSIVLKTHGPIKSHLTLEEIKELKSLVGAKHVIITHMGHDVDYESLSNQLDEDYLVSYDGFKCEV